MKPLAPASSTEPSLVACPAADMAGSVAGGAGTGADAVFATAAAARDAVDRARLTADLEFVAAERPPGSAHWQAVQDLCKSRLAMYGFEVELHNYGTGINVIGRRTGTTLPDEEVILSAHYDHIPGCAGADDNATGVAGVLEAARVTAGMSFARTLVLACWDEEERGLIGSTAYATRARMRGEDIRMMFSLEMIGYRDDAPGSQRLPQGFELLFPAQVATIHADQDRAQFLAIFPDAGVRPIADSLAAHAAAIGLPAMVFEITDAFKSSPQAEEMRLSDHAAFWDRGFHAILVTDTAKFRYAAYHCGAGPDIVANLDPAFLTMNVKASVGAMIDALGL